MSPWISSPSPTVSRPSTTRSRRRPTARPCSSTVSRAVATEIYGVVEAVLVLEIRPAIEYLEVASRVTAEELRERFERDRRRQDG